MAQSINLAGDKPSSCVLYKLAISMTRVWICGPWQPLIPPLPVESNSGYQRKYIHDVQPAVPLTTVDSCGGKYIHTLERQLILSCGLSRLVFQIL